MTNTNEDAAKSADVDLFDVATIRRGCDLAYEARSVLCEFGRTSEMPRYPAADVELGRRILRALLRSEPEGTKHLPYLALAAARIATHADLKQLSGEKLSAVLFLVGKQAMVGYIHGRIRADDDDGEEAAIGLWEDIVVGSAEFAVGWNETPEALDFFLRRYIDGPTFRQ